MKYVLNYEKIVILKPRQIEKYSATEILIYNMFLLLVSTIIYSILANYNFTF